VCNARAAAAAVGIDLGTTNSVVAVLRAGDAAPRVLPTGVLGAGAGAFTIPSIAAVDEGGEWLVGDAARAQARSNPLNTFYSAKRLIGRRYSEVAGAQLVYRICEGSDGGVRLACPRLDADITPQQVILSLECGCTGGPSPAMWTCTFAVLLAAVAAVASGNNGSLQQGRQQQPHRSSSSRRRSRSSSDGRDAASVDPATKCASPLFLSPPLRVGARCLLRCCGTQCCWLRGSWTLRWRRRL
jgi:hypothetical protein